MGSVSRVLVVGGGIGGLSATLALRRAGVEVDVAEINPEWSVYGVGIIQPGNALRALDALGLASEVIAQGFPMEGSRFHLADGTMLADLPAHRVAGPEYPPMNGITRSRLHVLLTDAVKGSGADVRLGVTVDAIDGGHVTFSDGSEGDYDLVVGADGIGSRVRSLVFGDEIQPEWTGQVCWRVNVPRPPDVHGIWMFVGTDGKAGIVPLAPDLAYVLLIEEPPPGGERVPDDRLAATMRERLAEFGGVIGEMRDEHIRRDEDVVFRPVMAVSWSGRGTATASCSSGTPRTRRRRTWDRARRWRSRTRSCSPRRSPPTARWTPRSSGSWTAATSGAGRSPTSRGRSGAGSWSAGTMPTSPG